MDLRIITRRESILVAAPSVTSYRPVFSLLIGLFGLLGLGGIAMGPFAGRLLDHIPPWHGILVSTLLLLLFQAVQTAAAGLNISAVIIACIGLDAVRQIQNVSIATKVFR